MGSVWNPGNTSECAAPIGVLFRLKEIDGIGLDWFYSIYQGHLFSEKDRACCVNVCLCLLVLVSVLALVCVFFLFACLLVCLFVFVGG